MENKLTLGSLFDGSGGFPLGGILNGITPVWASEIEPFPIRVTSKRIPAMKHLGSICDINGADIEPVDIITFGSPCTDMSVAGRRAGLDGKQSVLFYEAIRITKEMRCKTNGAYPRFIVWENVPGAFSSNKGEDFKAVLEAVIGIVRPKAQVPASENGKWPYADCYVGDGWSVAYRTLDAQYFGVAQRRRRIYLVADLGGERAAEILFESESLPGDPAPGIDSGEGSAGHAAPGFGESGILQSGGFCTEHSARSRGVGYEEERSPTIRTGVVPGTVISFEPGAASRLGGHCAENLCGALRASMGDNQLAVAIENHPTDSRVKVDERGTVQTLTSRMGTGGMNVPLIMSERHHGLPVTENIAQTLMGTDYKGVQCVCEATPPRPTESEEEPASFYPYMKAESQCFRRDGKANTLINGSNPGCQNGILDSEYIVRRLTPTECARLQGFPDHWCHGLESREPTEEEISMWYDIFENYRKAIGKSTKPRSRNQIEKWLNDPYSDAAEYKVWGNGVALPCVYFVLNGIIKISENPLI